MFQSKDSIVVLRFSRLGRIPPAQYASEMLEESGLPVLVIEYGNLKETKKEIQEPLRKLRLDGPWLKALPRKLQFPSLLVWVFIQLAWQFLSSGRPKIIVAHGSSEQLLAWSLSRLFFVPYVVHAHEVFEKEDLQGAISQFLLKMEKPIFRAASFTIFPEKKRAEIYQERYQFKKPIFISANTPRKNDLPQAVNLRQAYHLTKDSVLMGYVGGLGETNLLELAIQALATCQKVVFLVWGWGEKKYLEKLSSLAHVFGVSERFIHLGQLTEKKLETLAGCDISYCVYKPGTLRLDHAATASNKFFEAMSAGVPSVISSNRDFYQFNKHYSVGICAPTLTAEGIAQAIQTLQNNPSLRKQLGANGRRVFESLFHFENQFTKPLQAFQDLYYGYPELWRENQVYFPPQELPKAA